MVANTTPTGLQRVGAYRVESYLGQGGMGEVFLAFDERLKRPVALKRLHPDLSSGTGRKRMLQEARALARLRHPAIVQIYDLLEDGNHQFLVMEYVDGRTISDLLHENGPLPLPLGLSVARQVAAGLAEAHRQGIVHRDLKTENVMVTSAGDARILDFGLAKLKEDAARSLTSHGHVVGTYRAMAPEQALGRSVDARSDLFSLGVLLYEMLTGTSPFVSEHPMDTLRRIIEQDPPSPASLRPDLPVELVRLIEQLLQKEPSLRPPDADQVVRGLEGMSKASELAKVLANLLAERDQESDSAAAADLPTQVEGPFETSVPSTEPAPPEKPSRRTVLQRLVALTLVTVVALFLALRGGSEEDPLRVLVLEPEVVEDASLKLKNAAPAVFMATLEGLTALHEVMALEPSSLPPGMETRGKAAARKAALAVAGHEILQIRLDEAQDKLALVSMWRTDTSGSVLWRDSFIVPTSAEDLDFLAEEVLARLRTGFPKRAHRTLAPTSLRGEDRATLLKTKLRIKRGETLLQPELEVLETLLAKAPHHLETLLLAAEVAWLLFADTKSEHFLETANRYLQTAHSTAPDDPRTWIASVHFHLALNQPEEATQAMEMVERTRPGDPSTLLLSARILKSQGQVEAALASLRTALARRNTWHALYELADLEYQSGQVEAGRARFAELAELVPRNRWINHKIASLELLFGDLERAERMYQNLATIAPHRSVYTNLGLAAFLRGRWDQAVEAYQQALELAPGHLVVLLNLADAELARGRVAEAQAHYSSTLERLSELEPDSLSPLDAMTRAQCLAHLGDALGAVEITRQTLRQEPDHPEVLYMAAVVYAILGERTSALLHVSDAVALGYQARWFAVPIFDSLRQEPEFKDLFSTDSDLLN